MNKTTTYYNLLKAIALIDGECCLMQAILRYLIEDKGFVVSKPAKPIKKAIVNVFVEDDNLPF